MRLCCSILTVQLCQSSKAIRLVGYGLSSILQPLSHRGNVTSLSQLYRYYCGKCSNEIHPFVRPVQTFVTGTCRVAYTGSDHSHFLCIPLVSRRFHSESFIPGTVTEKITRGCFLDVYNLNLISVRINCYLSYMSSSYALLTSSAFMPLQ